MGSIKSAFKFDSYKIDKINFEMQKIVGLLQFTGNIDPEAWKINVRIRQPLFLKKERKYIGGVHTTLNLQERGIVN